MRANYLLPLFLSFTFILACGSGGSDEATITDGTVGACVASTGTADDIVGNWELGAIEGVPSTVDINGPLVFSSTGSYDFTAQVDTETLFLNYSGRVGSYSFTNEGSLLEVNGVMGDIFGTQISVTFCNDNTQFTFLDSTGVRFTYTRVTQNESDTSMNEETSTPRENECSVSNDTLSLRYGQSCTAYGDQWGDGTNQDLSVSCEASGITAGAVQIFGDFAEVFGLTIRCRAPGAL